MNRAPGTTLSAADLAAVIAVLRAVAGWLDNTSPAVLDDLDAHLRQHGSGLRAGDLPDRICRVTAMLGYRQIPGGTP